MESFTIQLDVCNFLAFKILKYKIDVEPISLRMTGATGVD